MPAIAKVTKEMIIDAAFETVKEMGAENINARTVSQKLGCSTQPVLYHFKTIEDVRIAAHKKASEFHIDYVTNLSGKYDKGKSLEEAIKCWKYKKQLQGHNRYERTDLVAIE